MFTFWFLLSIIIPFIMAVIDAKVNKAHYVFDFIAIIGFLYVSNLISFSLYNVIEDGEIFMTTIHAVFIDPNFLACGAYMIIYTTYKLIMTLK